jgi:hypothetical protein
VHLRIFQKLTPQWAVGFSNEFMKAKLAHKVFSHQLHHVMRAAGQLASVVDAAEHSGTTWSAEEVDPYLADLIICVLRMSHAVPGRTIDLEKVLVERIEQMNHVRVPRDEELAP